MNHSCNPNSYATIINESGDGPVDKEKMKIGIFANRFIDSGEEITYDYKFPLEEFDKIVCICNAINCRGFLN